MKWSLFIQGLIFSLGLMTGQSHAATQLSRATEFNQREFSGSKEVLRLLSSEFTIFKNPFCISRFARTDEMLALYVMSGHHIGLIKTTDETRLENQREVQSVKVEFLLKGPENEEVWHPAFYCTLK
ncbi:MAG: hypothetical protein KBD76_12465 [Bacteriovorax sp.]|nr:hypothetical protein [Bacteriovorax sp.]